MSFSKIRKEFDYYQMSYIDWKRDFCKQGFKMLYEEGICWFPFSRSSNSLLVPMFTMIEQRLGLRRLPNLSPWVVFLAQKISLHGCRE